jgi:hypothetical protein
MDDNMQVSSEGPKYDAKSHTSSFRSAHIVLIHNESIPFFGMFFSAVRVSLSSVQIGIGTVTGVVNGMMCNIPCREGGQLNEWQKTSRYHVFVGGYSLLEGLLNIGTGTFFQVNSALCKSENEGGVDRFTKFADQYTD